MGELRSTFTDAGAEKSRNTGSDHLRSTFEQPKVSSSENQPTPYDGLVGELFSNKDSGEYRVARVFSQQVGGSEVWSARLEPLNGGPHINKPIDESTGSILDQSEPPYKTWSRVEQGK